MLRGRRDYVCGVEELERFEKLEKEVLDVTFRKDLRERREKCVPGWRK
jgi:hypothetical protein